MASARPDTETRSQKVVAVIPAYNEERFIERVVRQAGKHVDIVLVVDDGSQDNTAQIAEAAGAVVLRHQRNRGKGAAVNSGFAKAREIGAQAVVLLDGDGQHQPSDIPRMVKPILLGEADMVIGSRYAGLASRIPLYRRIGQFIITALTSFFSGIPASDTWSGYRAFSRTALESIRFTENGWGIEPELQFQAREKKLEVLEVPIVALYEGKAKRNPLPHGLQTVNAILRLVILHRPFLLFGGTGMVTLAAGVAVGLWVVYRYNATMHLAMGSTLLCALLIILGALAFFTGVTLHAIRILFVWMDAGRTGE